MGTWTHKPYNSVEELLVDIRKEVIGYRFRDAVHENESDVYKDLLSVMVVGISRFGYWITIQNHDIEGKRIELTEHVLRNRLYVVR